MSRSVRAALAGAGGFVGGYCVPTFAFLIVYFFTAQPREDGSSKFEGLVAFFYFAGAYALAGAFAYGLITASSRNWCERPLRQIAGISVIWGAAAQILNWTGLAIIPLLPLTHVLPRNVTLMVGVAMSGIVTGAFVLIWSLARASRAAAAKRTQ